MNYTAAAPARTQTFVKKKGIHNIRGVISVSLIISNTLFFFPLLFPAGIIKWALPVKPVTRFFTAVVTWIATTWLSVNNLCTGRKGHSNR